MQNDEENRKSSKKQFFVDIRLVESDVYGFPKNRENPGHSKNSRPRPKRIENRTYSLPALQMAAEQSKPLVLRRL